MPPTLNGLQKMLQVCEHCAKDHNLRSSTNCNPRKIKNQMNGVSAENIV